MSHSVKKIIDLTQASKLTSAWKSHKERLVFTNGCFDILHLGHVDYLEKSKSLGSKLLVGVNSDNSVKRIKGDKRPYNNEVSRSRILAALSFVDLVVIFDEENPLKLIEILKPDILVKGNDYSVEEIVGAEFVKKNGGEVRTIPLVKGFSTTNIIEKIKNEC